MTTVVNRGPDGRNIGHDLTGQHFGILTILGPTEHRDPNGYLIWRAQCECGNTIDRASYRFIRGLMTCGCGPTGRPRIPDSGAHVNAIYASYRKSAHERKMDFHLTKAEVRRFAESPCAYCGAQPEPRKHRNLSGVYAWNGIDRVDNKQGYTLDNCVACCTRCNFAKSDQSLDDFRAWVARVAAHLTNF